MNNKAFLQKINDVKELKELPDTFWNKIKIKKGRRAINKMIKEVAQIQANIMYNQTYDFYSDIVENNLR